MLDNQPTAKTKRELKIEFLVGDVARCARDPSTHSSRISNPKIAIALIDDPPTPQPDPPVPTNGADAGGSPAESDLRTSETPRSVIE
jgi:hypothetical protein